MSIFGKKAGADPVDRSEILLSKDFADSGEELTEIEKTRRDLMVARLESFKREAAEQAATESSAPAPTATEPQKVTPVQVPQRHPESVQPVLTPKKPVVTQKPKEPKPVMLQPAGEVKAVHKSSVVKPPDEQASREVPPKPVSPVKDPVGANQQVIPNNIPQVKESDTGDSDSFITRSAIPRPSRKPPEPAKEPAKPAPEKLAEQTKPVSVDSTVSEKEKPTWRIKPKVESRVETPIQEKRVTEKPQQAIEEKPVWREPPKVETKVETPAPEKPEIKEPRPNIEKKPTTQGRSNVQSKIEELVDKKPVIETLLNEESDSMPAQDVSVQSDSPKTKDRVTQATESITREDDAQVNNTSKPQITLPYGEVPRKPAPADEVDKQIQEKSKEIISGYLEISGDPPQPAPAVSFEAADFKDPHDVAEASKAPEAEVRRYYPRSSGRYNHYDQYNQDTDKLIDDIMFGIVNADIVARRRQMTNPESE